MGRLMRPSDKISRCLRSSRRLLSAGEGNRSRMYFQGESPSRPSVLARAINVELKGRGGWEAGTGGGARTKVRAEKERSRKFAERTIGRGFARLGILPARARARAATEMSRTTNNPHTTIVYPSIRVLRYTGASNSSSARAKDAMRVR